MIPISGSSVFDSTWHVVVRPSQKPGISSRRMRGVHTNRSASFGKCRWGSLETPVERKGAAMSTNAALEERVFTEVKRLCYANLDTQTLHRRALAYIGRVVPFDGYCAHDADPASGLGMRMYQDPP